MRVRCAQGRVLLAWKEAVTSSEPTIGDASLVLRDAVFDCFEASTSSGASPRGMVMGSLLLLPPPPLLHSLAWRYPTPTA